MTDVDVHPQLFAPQGRLCEEHLAGLGYANSADQQTSRRLPSQEFNELANLIATQITSNTIALETHLPEHSDPITVAVDQQAAHYLLQRFVEQPLI